jgi:hypothetical protein
MLRDTFKGGSLMNNKRFIVCLLGGVICSIICATGMKLTGAGAAIPIILASGIGNRVLIGFVLGISRWKTNHILHGAIIGLVVTLSTSIGLLTQNIQGFMMYTCAGIIYGILIEILATNIFKAKMI